MLQYLNTNKDDNFKIFSNNIEQFQIGDSIRIQTFNKIENYTIIDIQIISREDAIRFRSYKRNVLILSTPYPFNYVGDTPTIWIAKAKKL